MLNLSHAGFSSPIQSLFGHSGSPSRVLCNNSPGVFLLWSWRLENFLHGDPFMPAVTRWMSLEDWKKRGFSPKTSRASDCQGCQNDSLFSYFSWAKAVLYSNCKGLCSIAWYWFLKEGCMCTWVSENLCKNNSFLLLSVPTSMLPDFRHYHGEGWRENCLHRLFPSYTNELMQIHDCKHLRNSQSTWILVVDTTLSSVYLFLTPLQRNIHTPTHAHTHTPENLSVNIILQWDLTCPTHLFKIPWWKFDMPKKRTPKVIWYVVSNE